MAQEVHGDLLVGEPRDEGPCVDQCMEASGSGGISSAPENAAPCGVKRRSPSLFGDFCERALFLTRIPILMRIGKSFTPMAHVIDRVLKIAAARHGPRFVRSATTQRTRASEISKFFKLHMYEAHSLLIVES